MEDEDVPRMRLDGRFAHPVREVRGSGVVEGLSKGLARKGTKEYPRSPGAIGPARGIGRVGSTNHSVTCDVTAGP